VVPSMATCRLMDDGIFAAVLLASVLRSGLVSFCEDKSPSRQPRLL
jgi:hypothetical protein